MSSDEYKEFEEIFGDAGFGDSSFGDSGFGSSGFGNSGFESADIFMWISIVLFAIVFVAVIAIFIVVLVRSLMRWNKNNNSPRLTVEATIVAKRPEMMHYHGGNDALDRHHTYRTVYYVTFQVESGDRLELEVDGQEYGILVEGDVGSVTFQGTRYLGFQRR